MEQPRSSARLPSVHPTSRPSPSRSPTAQHTLIDISSSFASRQGSASPLRRSKVKLLQHLEQARADALLPYRSRSIPPSDRFNIAQQLLMKFSINFPTYKTYLDEIQADYRAAWESQQHDLAKSQPLKRELALAKRSQAAEITNLKDSIQDSSRLAESNHADTQRTVRTQRIMIDDLRAQVQHLQDEVSEESSKGRKERAARLLMAERVASGVNDQQIDSRVIDVERQEAQLEGLRLKNKQLEKQLQAVVEDYHADVTSRMSAKAAEEMISRLELDVDAAQAATQQAKTATMQSVAEVAELRAEAATHMALITKLRCACAKAEQELRALKKESPSEAPITVDSVDLSWFQGELPSACQAQHLQGCVLEWDLHDLEACLNELSQAYQASKEQNFKTFFSHHCNMLAESLGIATYDVACTLLMACRKHTTELSGARQFLRQLQHEWQQDIKMGVVNNSVN